MTSFLVANYTTIEHMYTLSISTGGKIRSEHMHKLSISAGGITVTNERTQLLIEGLDLKTSLNFGKDGYPYKLSVTFSFSAFIF